MRSLAIISLHVYCWVRGWKKNWKSVNIWQIYGQKYGVLLFDSRGIGDQQSYAEWQFSTPGSPKPLTDFNETWNLELSPGDHRSPPRAKCNFNPTTMGDLRESQFLPQYVSFFAFLVFFRLAYRWHWVDASPRKLPWALPRWYFTKRRYIKCTYIIYTFTKLGQ